MRRMLVAIVLAALLAAPLAAAAQPRTAEETEREQAYVEALRREDSASADRYLALRDARAQAFTELKKVELQYNGAGAGLRGLFVNPLRQARKKYAETSLRLLDFYDERDRAVIARYQEEIGKITGLLEERKKTRAQLEELRAP